MEYKEILDSARTCIGPYCKACPVCNGKACGNQVPGPGAKAPGNGFVRNFDAWQKICVNMDTICPNEPVDTAVELFGTMYRYPFFAAPLGAMKMHYGDKYNDREYNSILVNACADSGIAAFTGDGVHKQLVDVAQAAGFAVDGIFTLTAAVIAAGDHDLGVFGVEDAGAVIENERHLREAHGAALFRAAEDDVLHLAAAQRLRALLTHDPQDGVRYVRLAAPVRADDRRDLLVKIQARLVRKGLEALDLQCF